MVDSDFDIDENDEPVSDHDGEEEKKRKRGVFTKAYKEPAKPTKPKAKETKEIVPRKRRTRDKNEKLARMFNDNIGKLH